MSQAKHYCKFCNTWIADNKMSRQNHEFGRMHKENVALFHKKKRDEKLHGARSEAELKQQMEAIDRAAKEAIASDRAAHGDMFYSHKPPPPPVPPRCLQTEA